MESEISSDLAAFVHFAQGRLRDGEGELSPEECLSLYRAQHATDEDIAAVKEALEAMHRGDVGLPVEEFDHYFRQKNGLSPRG